MDAFTEEVDDAWQGTLCLQAWNALLEIEAAHAVEARGSAQDRLGVHQAAVVEALLSALLASASAAGAADSDGMIEVPLLERPATLAGCNAVHAFLRDTLPLLPGRHAWCHLRLAGPIVTVEAMQKSMPDAHASVVIVPHSEGADLDRHVWPPRLLAACRDASALMLVVDKRVETFGNECLKAALPGCALPGLHRTKVTVVNSTDQSPASFEAWSSEILAEIHVAVRHYCESEALSDKARNELLSFRARAMSCHKGNFLELLRQAESNVATGGKLAATHTVQEACHRTGTTGLLGFLQCFSSDADLARVRNLEARASRELAAYESLIGIEKVPLSELTAFVPAVRGAPINNERINERLLLEQRFIDGLRVRINDAINVVWGDKAAQQALEQLQQKLQEQRAQLLGGDDDRMLTRTEAVTALKAAVNPLIQWYQNRADAAWNTIVADCVEFGVSALRCGHDRLLQPAVMEALQAEALALLDGSAHHVPSDVRLHMEALHKSGGVSPFRRTARDYIGQTGSVYVENRAVVRLSFHTNKYSNLKREVTHIKLSALASAFDNVIEALEDEMGKALRSQAPGEAKRQVFPADYTRMLAGVFQAAHRERGASDQAATEHSNSDASVNKAMKAQLHNFVACCVRFRNLQPERERSRGWALLRGAACRVVGARARYEDGEDEERDVRQRR